MTAFPKSRRAPRRSKYGAKSVILPTGEAFPSQLEAAVYQILLLRVRAGEIRDVKRQATVHLGFGLKWKVDFSFTVVANNLETWCEAKGMWDRQAKRNLKMWTGGAGPGPLEIWQGSWKRPIHVKTVVPKPKETPQEPSRCDGCQCAGLPDSDAHKNAVSKT